MSKQIRVLMIGSSAHLVEAKEKDAQWMMLRKAVQDIAQNYIEAGFVIVTMADRLDVIAQSVVDGGCAAYKSKSDAQGKLGSVEMHLPAAAPEQLRALGNSESWIRAKSYPASVDSDAINVRALESCDAVVLFGGGRGTKSVGLAASLMSKAIVPVGCFGGAAEQVWQYGSSHRRRFFYDVEDSQIDELNSNWSGKGSVQNVLDLTQALLQGIAKSKTPPSLIYVVISFMVLAMMLWVACLAGPSLLAENRASRRMAGTIAAEISPAAAPLGVTGRSVTAADAAGLPHLGPNDALPKATPVDDIPKDGAAPGSPPHRSSVSKLPPAAVLGGATSEYPGAWTLPLLLIAATLTGIIGASVQTLRLIRDCRAVSSASILVDSALGFIVGVISAVLYLIAEIGVTGKLELVKASDDFVRVALMISLIAFFAGAYLDTALTRFDGLRESILRGKLPNEPSSSK